MKRRTFLQSVLGVLVAPCLPVPKTTITDSKPIVGEWGSFGHIRWMTGKPPTQFETIAGWKMIYVTRILNDNYIHSLTTSA